MRKVLAISTIAVMGLSLGACSTAESGSPDPVAAATTTPLGSVVSQVADCAGGTSMTLMTAGQDPHTVEASSQQIAQIAKAKVIFSVGLGLEAKVQPALDNLARDGSKVVQIAPQVSPIEFGSLGHEDHKGPSAADAQNQTEEEGHTEEDGHDHSGQDPHFWMDVNRMSLAANVIGKELTQATGDDKYTQCGQQVADELKRTDQEVKNTLDSIPASKRILVTDHDAFGYFSQAYGFKSAQVVVKGGSTDAQPSSADIAATVKVIKDTKVPAIFSNTAVSPAYMDTLAKESGTDVKVVPLHVGSVGPQGSDAHSYSGMMKANATAIADALK